jgi:hypothetical protein
VGHIDFKVISAAEKSNKFPKTRFWKEKSVEDVDQSTLGTMAQATLVYRSTFSALALIILFSVLPKILK